MSIKQQVGIQPLDLCVVCVSNNVSIDHQPTYTSKNSKVVGALHKMFRGHRTKSTVVPDHTVTGLTRRPEIFQKNWFKKKLNDEAKRHYGA